MPSVDVLPPNPGVSGCMRLDVGGGDSYHVLFPPEPDVTVRKNDASHFELRDPHTAGLCPTTTTSSTTSTTIFTLCGNGVRDPGEECDGGALCDATCRQTIPSCCSFNPLVFVCNAAPNFSLYSDLYYYWARAHAGLPSPGMRCNAGVSENPQ